MSFNKKDFGENLKKSRKEKGLTQENLGRVINKNATTIGRYENGTLLPNAEEIALLCDELNIYEYELFDSKNKIQNKDKNINPFGTDTLYLFYKAYFHTKMKYGKGKFKLILKEKGNSCDVDFVDYKTNKIYLTGYLLANDYIASFVFENYKPTSPRLEVAEMIINISDGIEQLMLGTYLGTNGKYQPSIRKCIVTKEDVEFDDSMFELLKISDNDKKELAENDILYIDTKIKEDFEE